jgi:molecular chaperone GrpE
MSDPYANDLPEDQNDELQPASGLEAGGPTIEEALKQIEMLGKEALDSKDKMLRALAEAENTRRRAERDRADASKFAVTGFARDMLSVSDNLRRALSAIPAEQRNNNEQLKTIYEGVEATERELLRAFEKNGIVKVDPQGQKFDPNLHEVIFEIPSADKEAGTVLQVVESGYMIHERLLRPARVGVAKNDGPTTAGAKIDQQV